MKNEASFNHILPGALYCGRTRWMVVDDNADVLEFVSTLLATISDAEVWRFRSGAEAAEAFASAPESFRFVITDLEMPGMSGIELCRWMQTLSPRLNILLMTGSAIVTREEAARFGFCGLLKKPLLPAALKQAIEALRTPNRRATSENRAVENSPRDAAVFAAA